VNMISQFFSRSEIACGCGCGLDTMDAETLKLADECRVFVGRSITPSSGARCLDHNRKEGSRDTSQHVKCRAMDLPVNDPKLLYDYLCDKYPEKYGFGLYKSFVHIDSRSGAAKRWAKT
jgi:zinc D-Ala-D-Ala carboxypeptidase